MIITDILYKKPLSVSVMAHPKRAHFFDDLKAKLGDVPFSVDENSEGVWANARKAWAMYDPEATYHVVIQDDAVVCDDFYKRAEDVLKDAMRGFEMPAISFYFGNRGTFKGIVEEGLERGYCTMGRTPWAVAICMPTYLIPDMLKFCDELAQPQDDVRIGKFIRSLEKRVYFPLPSLIDHRTGEESLVGDPGKMRRAAHFIDRV